MLSPEAQLTIIGAIRYLQSVLSASEVGSRYGDVSDRDVVEITNNFMRTLGGPDVYKWAVANPPGTICPTCHGTGKI